MVPIAIKLNRSLILKLTPENYQNEFRLFIKQNQLNRQQALSIKEHIEEHLKNLPKQIVKKDQPVIENAEVIMKMGKKELEKEKKEPEKEKKFVGPQYEEIEKLFKDREECSSPEPQERQIHIQPQRQQSIKKDNNSTLPEPFSFRNISPQTEKKVIRKPQFHQPTPKKPHRMEIPFIRNAHFLKQTENTINRQRGDQNMKEEKSYNEMIEMFYRKEQYFAQNPSDNRFLNTTESWRRKFYPSRDQKEEGYECIPKNRSFSFTPPSKRYRSPSFQLKGPYCEAKKIRQQMQKAEKLRIQEQRRKTKKSRQRIQARKQSPTQSIDKKKKEHLSRCCECCNPKTKSPTPYRKRKTPITTSTKNTIEQPLQKKRIKNAMRSILSQSYQQFERHRIKLTY